MPKLDLSDHEKRQLSLATERSSFNDMASVVQILRPIVADHPEIAKLAAYYANALKLTGEVAASEDHFRRAVNIAPHSELYSLGLFHCLWQLGKVSTTIVLDGDFAVGGQG